MLFLLYNLLSCIGYFLIMLIFMILALTSAKPQFAWVWYIIGGISQFISLLGNQNVIQNITWYWVIYFAILIVVAALIINRGNRGNSKPQKEESSDTIQQPSNDYTKTNHETLEEKIKEDETVEVKIETPMIDKIQFCSKCGSELMDDAIFCHICGTSVHIQESLEANCAESNDTLVLQGTKKLTNTQKKPKRLSWLWITVIAFNCCAVIAGIIAPVYELCYHVYLRAVATWRYINIDSSYQVGYSVEEYSNQISWIDEEILLFAIISIGIIFVFVALSILNSYICKKKLNIKRKKIRALPWLCTLTAMLLVCGGIALSYVFEYEYDIAYYQQKAEDERIEREKILAEEKQATELLMSTQEAMNPSEALEYALRYPDKSIGEMIKITGVVTEDGNFLFLSNSENNKYVSIIYNQTIENKPRLLGGDSAVVVGKIVMVKTEDATSDTSKRIDYHQYGTYNKFVRIKIYDWEIIS